MASTPMTSHPPTPERIFDTLLAHQQAAALRAALDLDVFTAIAQRRRHDSCSRERDESIRARFTHSLRLPRRKGLLDEDRLRRMA